MVAAGAPVLRPLSMGQLLDQAVRIYRRSFLRFVGIIAAVQVPLTLLQWPLSWLTLNASLRAGRSFEGPEALAPYLIATVGSLLLTLLSFALTNGVAAAVLSRAAADTYLGQPVDFATTLRRIGRSWRPLIGTVLLALLLGLAMAIWAMVPCIGWFSGIGMLVFSAWIILPLGVASVVLERKSGMGALRRGWTLGRRRFWWAVGLVGLLAILGMVVRSPASLLGMLWQYLPWSRSLDWSSQLVLRSVGQTLVALLGNLIYLPLQFTAMTLLYLDLRVRTEGLDLTLQAEGALQGEVRATDLLAQAPPAERAGFVSGAEFGYFTLLSLAIVAVYLLMGGVILGLTRAFFLTQLP